MHAGESVPRARATLADDAGLVVRSCTAADEDAVLALHVRGFGRDWSAAQWRWCTTAAPLGATEAIGAFARDGRCVALIVAVGLPCRWQGRRELVLSGTDVVLDPALRSTLLGARVLQRIIEQTFASFGVGRALFMFGAPVQPMLRLLTARHAVEVLGDVYGLVQDLEGPTPAPALPVAAFTGAGAAIDELWRRCGIDAGVVRDFAFLDWRFCRHPTVHYDWLAARGGDGRLRGLVIVRDGGWHPDILSLVEWLVPPGDDAAEVALLHAARQLARARGRQRLVTMFAAHAPEHRRFQLRHGFYLHPTAHQLAFRSFRCDVTRPALFTRWHLTLADLEFL